MKFQIQLQSTRYAAAPKLVAATTDPHLIKQFIEGLYANYLVESDEQDRIFDPAFLRSAPALIADLNREIRREASRGFLEEDTGDSPDLSDC